MNRQCLYMRLMLGFFLLMSMVHTQAYAATFTAFGPKIFVRGSSKPVIETASFNIKNPNITYTLKIYNGGQGLEYSKVSSAVISLNNTTIFDTNDFNQQVSFLQKQVNVSNSNQLQVELRSDPGSGLTVLLEGEDSTPPSVIINSPANGVYLNTPSITVSGTASDSISWVSTVTVNAATAAFTGETYTSNIQLTEVTNTITVAATDAAGNSSNVSVSVVLDTIPPKITIDPVSSLTNKPQLTISGKIEDASPISSFTVNSSPVTLTNNSFTAVINLIEGNNTIRMAATDKAENTSSSTMIVNLDTTPPVISIISPVNGMTVNTGTVAVSGSIDDNMATVTVNRKNATISRGTFTADGLILAEGLNNITVNATDSIGNINTATITVTYIVPNPAPVITIQYPLDGSTVYLPSITVSGKVDDPTAIININGISAKTSNCQKPDPLVLKPEEINEGRIIIRDVPQYSVLAVKSDEIEEGPICFSGAINLVEGMNKVTVTATNSSGKSTTTIITVSAIVSDTTPPVITITSPVSYSIVASSSITVTGTIDDNTASITVNGVNATTISNNSFTATVELREGYNSIVVMARDTAWNTTTKYLAISRDMTPPIVYDINSYDGRILNDSIENFYVFVLESDGTPTVTINGIDLTPIKYSHSINVYDVTAESLALNPGVNTITIKAMDYLGNTGTKLITVYVEDTRPPYMYITSPGYSTAVYTESVDVTGWTNDCTATVSVNGVSAVISGNTFTATGVPLKEGGNNITATAVDTSGNASTYTIRVSRYDNIAPAITINTQDGITVNTTKIIVTGTIDSAYMVKVNGSIAKIYPSLWIWDTTCQCAVLVYYDTKKVSDNMFDADVYLFEGANTITVTATDNSGNQSTKSIIVYRDTKAPVLKLSSPPDRSYVTTNTVMVTGIIDDNTATVTVNSTTSIVSDKVFTTDLTLVEGDNTIIIIATDPMGNSTSVSIAITCDTTVPSVTSTVPAFNATGIPLDTAISVNFNEAMNTSTITSSNFSLSSESGPVSGTVSYNGNAATYTPSKRLSSDTVYTATIRGGLLGVRDVAGNSLAANYSWVFKTGSIPIEITEPYDGETINKATAIIKGTINYQTQEIGITVNGVIAEINGNTWTAIVPLNIGQNVIEATATDTTGNKYKHAITINTNSIQQPLTITTNPHSGIAPLNSTFSIDTSISNTITSYKIDFEGDGVTDQQTTTTSNVTHIYDTPGIYYPTVTVTDSQGNTYTETAVVNVLDRTQMDALLKGKWDGMKGALVSGNIDGALSYYLDGSKEKYQTIYTALKDQLPGTIEAMNDIELIYVENGKAQYRIRRLEADGEFTYYISFLLDSDGLWKIYQY